MAEITTIPFSPQASEVERVCAVNGESLPRRSFDRTELIIIVEGCISLERDDCAEPELHVATEMIEISAGVERRITAHETPTQLVLIRPA